MRRPMNIPNQITMGRLVIAGAFFAVLSTFSATRQPVGDFKLALCFWLFLAASLSDILDGYLARTWGQVTAFGRVVDPVVDKIMIGGAFVFFASHTFFDASRGVNITGVQPWMVVLILVRELLISAIRALSESQGRDFGASWVGKLKMFVQSASVCMILGQLAWFPSLAWLRVACVWGTVIITLWSTISYLGRARSHILSAEALGAAPPPLKISPAPTESPARRSDKPGLSA